MTNIKKMEEHMKLTIDENRIIFFNFVFFKMNCPNDKSNIIKVTINILGISTSIIDPIERIGICVKDKIRDILKNNDNISTIMFNIFEFIIFFITNSYL